MGTLWKIAVIALLVVYIQACDLAPFDRCGAFIRMDDGEEFIP